MRNRLAVLALAVALALAAAGVLRRRGASSASSAGDPPPAPGFTLPSDRGEQVSLESLRGRVVAVNFWATWCGPCKAEIPDLAAVYAANRDRCVEFLGVAEESSDRGEVRDVGRQLGINYPILFDDDGKVGEAFRIPGYPWTFLVDAQGRIRKTFRGAITRGELEVALAPLLGEVAAGCPKLARGLVGGARPR